MPKTRVFLGNSMTIKFGILRILLSEIQGGKNGVFRKRWFCLRETRYFCRFPDFEEPNREKGISFVGRKGAVFGALIFQEIDLFPSEANEKFASEGAAEAVAQ